MIRIIYPMTPEMDDLVLRTIIDNSQRIISVTGEPVDIQNTQYNVCFYNTHHFGDTFFIQPFVKHICDSNPTITFYYWFRVGHAAFNGIPNLIRLEPIEDDILCQIAIEHKNTKFFDFFYEEYIIGRDLCTFDYRGKSFISCNTCWNSFNTCVNTVYVKDMDYLGLLLGFSNKMTMLNNIFQFSLDFDFHNHKMFPDLPLIPSTDRFSEWIKIFTGVNGQRCKKNLIFIYNYQPRYCMASFMSLHELNCIIGDICRSNPHVHIIVPQYNAIFEDIENITCCDRDFGFTEDRTCTNLLQIEHVLQYCRLVVTLPSGSAWTFMNKHISSYVNKTTFYLLGDYTFYSKRLNNWYKHGTGKPDDIIQCIGINEMAGLIRNFNY